MSCVFVQAALAEEGVLLRDSLSKMDWESWPAIGARTDEVPLWSLHRGSGQQVTKVRQNLLLLLCGIKDF